MTEDHLREEREIAAEYAAKPPKEDVEPMYRTLLARNVRAFLEAKGGSVELENTPEYLTTGAKLLKKIYGLDLAAYICRQDDTKRFNRWCRGADLPKHYEAKGLLAAIEVTEILLGRFTAQRAMQWMITPCPYILDDLPMDYIRLDSDLVRRAALQNFV